MADKTAMLRGIPTGDDVSIMDKVRALTWTTIAGSGDSVFFPGRPAQIDADQGNRDGAQKCFGKMSN
jgi:hypothetical protein